MSKSTVVKWFFGSRIRLTGGGVLLIVTAVALANDVFIRKGLGVVRSGPVLAWTLVDPVPLAMVVRTAAAAAAVALFCGVLLTTLAYVIADPDGTKMSQADGGLVRPLTGGTFEDENPQTGRVDLPRGPVTVLVALLAGLAVVSSIVGLIAHGGPGRHAVTTARGVAVTLYGEGLYAADSWLIGIGNRGQDGAMLLIEVPILLLVLRWYRQGGSVAPRLWWECWRSSPITTSR